MHVSFRRVVGSQISIGLVMKGANIYLVGNKDPLKVFEQEERVKSTRGIDVSAFAPSGKW